MAALKEQLLLVQTKEAALSSEKPALEETCSRLEKEKNGTSDNTPSSLCASMKTCPDVLCFSELVAENTALKLDMERLEDAKKGAEESAKKLVAKLEGTS